jgi:GT2 family glycosyltransferase
MAPPHPSSFRPVRVTCLELSEPGTEFSDLAAYREVLALVRLHGSPVGVVVVPVRNGRCPDAGLRREAVTQLAWPLIRHLITDALAAGISEAPTFIRSMATLPHAGAASPLPSITVAVCTRDRTADLAQCLDALLAQSPAPDEIVVVDNAPKTDGTERLVAQYPGVRYVKESRPGLDWARNRAIAEGTCEIVAFTDDDVVVDTRWVGAIKRSFADRPDAMALTGLVMPFELETEAQELFERYGGFGRGFERRWYRVDDGQNAATEHIGAGKFGTGANMAYRRAIFGEIGLFDPALDVGTVTNGGGDLEMLFRVLDHGHVLIYEPDAIVWHRHRREYGKLREQIANNGVGFYSFLTQVAKRSPRHRRTVAWFGLWWFCAWSLRRFLISTYKPGAFPRELVLAELVGSIKGLFRYKRASVNAFALGAPDRVRSANAPQPAKPPCRRTPSVRTVDMAHPVGPIMDAAQHPMIDLFVHNDGRLSGPARIASRHRPVSGAEVRQAIANALSVTAFLDASRSHDATWAEAVERVTRAYAPDDSPDIPLDLHIDVSVVVATFDRPDDLRNALRSLVALRTPRRVDIVVVDNHPGSGQTPRVVAEFPGVRLVEETRGGLSYARNAGIAAATGAIIVSTDDDVVVPPDWLERLVTPFTDSQVMVVTGNVLPIDLAAGPQRLFEAYGGLGRGCTPYSVDRKWFWSFRGAPPTWALGGTANAAFRAEIFRHPDIGLLDESLGAGTPTGCSEDTDLFYRVLRAGYRIVYEPQAYVWHRHRSDMRALRRQIYAYAKGHVAYQLTTLVRNREWRAVTRLIVELPRIYLWRVRERLLGRSDYPLHLVILEIAGTIAGPSAWLRSLMRVRRLGRSRPYEPVQSTAPREDVMVS